MMLASRHRCYTDADHASVILHLPMVGPNGSTTFTDFSDAGHGITTSGGLALSNAQKKWPEASAYFVTDKTIAVTTDSSFSISGDFTIEFWFYGSLAQCIFSNASSTYLYNNTLWINGSSVISSIGLDTTGSWKFLSISRSGTTISVYQDGVLKKTGTTSATVNLSSLYIGFYKPNNNTFITGYMQDFRVSSGIVRSPAIPTLRFPWR